MLVQRRCTSKFQNMPTYTVNEGVIIESEVRPTESGTARVNLQLSQRPSFGE